MTKVLVNFEVNKCKNFETFKTFFVILNYEKGQKVLFTIPPSPPPPPPPPPPLKRKVDRDIIRS